MRLTARLAAAAALLLVVNLHAHYMIQSLQSDALFDLQCFLSSAANARSGMDPYRPADPAVAPNRNAPLSLLLLWPLGGLECRAVAPLWTAVSFASYLLALYLALRHSRLPAWGLATLWAIALVGLYYTLAMGQLYTFLALLVVSTVLLAPHHPVLAALLVGLLVALKPNFALLPLVMFAAGHRRLAIYSAGAAALLATVPVLAFGPTIYLAWLEVGIGYSNVSPDNGALTALVAPMGISAIAVAILLALLALYGTYRARPDVLAATTVGVSLSLLCAPAAWTGYAVLLVPLVLLRQLSAPRTLAAALLVVPSYPIPLLLRVYEIASTGRLFGLAMLILLADGLLTPSPVALTAPPQATR